MLDNAILKGYRLAILRTCAFSPSANYEIKVRPVLWAIQSPLYEVGCQCRIVGMHEAPYGSTHVSTTRTWSEFLVACLLDLEGLPIKNRLFGFPEHN
jgi:hypothetical protein